MEFSAKIVTLSTQASDCLVVTVSQPRKLSASAHQIDTASSGYLSALLQAGDMEGRVGQTLLLRKVAGIAAERVLLVGTGKDEEMNEQLFSRVVGAMVSSLGNCGAKNALACLGDIRVGERPADWNLRQATILVNSALYRFEQMKSGKGEDRPALKKFIFQVAARRDLKKASEAIRQGRAIGSGMDLARDLGNLPANVCTPTYLARQAQKLARGNGRLKATVLDEAAMRKLKMGSLLSVAAGSRQPARLITLEYRGAGARDNPVVLVGKGVTFDTGGISLKPGAAMDEMKFDMCGAASVIGTLKTVAELELPINVVGIVPATENMPDGIATRPGDIVTSMSGQTIEILNTDAEGRLILCDALTYAEKFKPRCVVDVATLTGACIVALGKVPSAVLGNNEALIQALVDSGKQIDDKVWQLPLWDEYQEQLNSNFADMANIGGRDAGTITAACFLSRFTKKFHWAHLDIAGTAWKSGEQKGATGRPVPLLTQFILNQLSA